MNIQPIVEGHGDVVALPVLLRRLRDEAGAHAIEINRPIRRQRHHLVREATLRQAVQLARLQSQCGGILIVFDSDDDCPATLAPVIEEWAKSEVDVPCRVVLAHREFEAWFLASIESLRGRRGVLETAPPHESPESPRDAKGEIEARMRMGRSYQEPADQPAFAAHFDVASAHRKCRSFRRLVRAFGELLGDVGGNRIGWPPQSWRRS